jgi:nitroreductase
MSSHSMEEPAGEQPLTALEALHSTPSRRYLSPEPIPDDVLWEILDTAIRGPSGGNAQHWGWVVVTDQEVKDRVAAWYRVNWEAAYGSRREQILNAEVSPGGLTPRGFLGAEYHPEG